MTTKQETVWAESSEHAATLTGEKVAVYRKRQDGTLVPYGHGRWERGMILGSDVNCGVLAHLEPRLRELTGTP
jgi:hypothetical protein